MTIEEFRIWEKALGRLFEQLNDHSLTIERFETFVYEETKELQPLDGKCHTETDAAMIGLISDFAANTVIPMTKFGWGVNRSKRLLEEFGGQIALGKITPTSIAVLTNFSSEDFGLTED
mgnify:CR=1 FL=1